jgi:uncharacterized protein (TIGR02588 family)
VSAREDTGGRPHGRKLAEWVTLSLSALTVAGVAAFLVYEALRGDPPLVPVHVRVLADQAQRAAGRYVVPVEVRNDGRQTLKDLKVQVRYRSPDGKPQTNDFLIDYLGEGTRQKVYLYFDRHPSELQVEAEPLAYQIE